MDHVSKLKELDVAFGNHFYKWCCDRARPCATKREWGVSGECSRKPSTALSVDPKGFYSVAQQYLQVYKELSLLYNKTYYKASQIFFHFGGGPRNR